jgi:hypothetical protein
MEVVANTLGATRAFDANTLPWMWRLAPGVEVLMPTRPVELYILCVFRIDEMFIVATMAFGAVIAFEAYKLPAT